MARAATFMWTSPPPTSVDEVLVIGDDGTADLVIRRPRRVSATVGSYRASPSAEDLATLVAVGPGPVTFHLPQPDDDRATDAVRVVAERVVEACLAGPRATATFTSAVTGVEGAGLSVALLVVAHGPEPIELELRPERSVVHLSGPGGEITWLALPRPETGFVTASATGVGGLGARARMREGEPAGTTFEVPDVPGATTIAIEVAGWLSEALPDEPEPTPFVVRTPEAPIPR